MKKMVSKLVGAALALTALGFTGCEKKQAAEKQVIIYGNSDDESVVAFKNALDENGYAGKYIFQSFSTNELAGKLFAEGTDIEADIIAINTFYIESTQKKNSMYKELSFKEDCLVPYESYYLPFIGNYGSIIVNTKVMEEKNLPYPKTIKDLANPVYKDWLSVCDLAGSTTAWYMFLPLISDYGEEQTKEILHAIYENAGPHLEMSGSAPLKKVRAGEVAIGFGLRHQAVKDKRKGLPVDFIDPLEGSYSMTESVAMIDKGKKTNPLAEVMLRTMIEKGRKDLINDYPVPVYAGETVSPENMVPNGKVFAESLTAELFTKHRAISESAK